MKTEIHFLQCNYLSQEELNFEICVEDVIQLTSFFLSILFIYLFIISSS